MASGSAAGAFRIRTTPRALYGYAGISVFYEIMLVMTTPELALTKLRGSFVAGLLLDEPDIGVRGRDLFLLSQLGQGGTGDLP